MIPWRPSLLAVAHEEEFSLAVAEKVGQVIFFLGGGGQFWRSNTFNQIGF